jgi:hypothetical protein
MACAIEITVMEWRARNMPMPAIREESVRANCPTCAGEISEMEKAFFETLDRFPEAQRAVMAALDALCEKRPGSG